MTNADSDILPASALMLNASGSCLRTRLLHHGRFNRVICARGRAATARWAERGAYQLLPPLEGYIRLRLVIDLQMKDVRSGVVAFCIQN